MQDRRFSPLLLITIVVAAAGMALVGFFWLGGPAAPTPLPQPPELVVKKAPSTTSNSSKAAPTGSTQPSSDAPPALMTAPIAANVSAEQKARQDADIKIGTLLAQNPTVEGARDKLLLLFPSFTPFEKIAAAPHIVNLTGDEQLATVVGFLKNPLTPAEAQETFFNDMLNRAPQTGWPVLVEVIATPKHPLAERAKELLTTIVGQDYGNDVFGWQRGLRDQLKAQGALPEDAPTTKTMDAPPAPVPQQ
jgi:hypothetical protein